MVICSGSRASSYEISMKSTREIHRIWHSGVIAVMAWVGLVVGTTGFMGSSAIAQVQEGLTIRIEPRFGDAPLEMFRSRIAARQWVIPAQNIASSVHTPTKPDDSAKAHCESTAIFIPADTITITALRFYCSAIVLNGVAADTSRARLVDASDSATLIIPLRVSFPLPRSLPTRLPSIERREHAQLAERHERPENIVLQCRLGVDSATNSAGALRGDLDPIRGMYWAWQSGYINFKLEGTSARCTARKKKFQFHLGGYLPPLQTVQVLTFSRNTAQAAQSKEWLVIVDVREFLAGIDLATLHTVMSPSPDAVRLARKAASAFRLQNPE